jgi:hypothetical protein
VDEFIRQNADPIWLHQNEMWEYLVEPELRDPFPLEDRLEAPPGEHKKSNPDEEEVELPF